MSVRLVRKSIAPLLVALLVAGAVLALVHKLSGDDSTRAESSSREATTSGTARALQSTDPSVLNKEKQNLNDRVKMFAELYFSLSSDETAEEAKEEVTSLVTSHFMETAQFGLGTSSADQAMKAEHSSIKAEVVSDFEGELEDANTASGFITLHITKYDKNGSPVLSFDRDQALVLVREQGSWRIYATPSS